MANIEQKSEQLKKHLQDYTCWRCKHTWSDVPLVEDTVVCPECGYLHGKITTKGKMIPRRR